MATELFDAAELGNLSQVQAILDSKVSVDVVDRDSRTALHLACSDGNSDVVELLINSRANLDAEDRWGHQPLKYAIIHGFRLVFEALTQRGATLSHKGQRDLECELCRAAAEGNIVQLKETQRSDG